MSEACILCETDERGVATLTLNRPEKHNAMNAALMSEMRAAIAKLGADDSIRAVVLTGAGKSFCAGGDLNWMKEQQQKDRAGRIGESRQLASMLAELNALPKPVIGRINGAAYGGGVGMASVCDIAIATEEARFGLTEVRLGLIPATISPYVIARIGEANARRVFLNARLFDAVFAREIGLIGKVVPAGDLDAAVEEEISLILNCAPGAVARAKALIDYVARHHGEDNYIYTADRLADAWETAEAREGIEAFLNKGRPSWRR